MEVNITETNAEEVEVQQVSMITIHKDNDPEIKRYLILIVGTDEDGDDFRDFEFVTGRTAAYNYIKNLVEVIDLVDSKIVVDSEKIEDMKPVLRFMKYVLDTGLIIDPGFDIMDHMVGDYDYDKEG